MWFTMHSLIYSEILTQLSTSYQSIVYKFVHICWYRNYHLLLFTYVLSMHSIEYHTHITLLASNLFLVQILSICVIWSLNFVNTHLLFCHHWAVSCVMFQEFLILLHVCYFLTLFIKSLVSVSTFTVLCLWLFLVICGIYFVSKIMHRFQIWLVHLSVVQVLYCFSPSPLSSVFI